MTMKPFEIQSTSLSIGGVTIDTSAQGKLVIPGVTRASTSVAIEVDDTGDQSYSFGSNADPTTITIIDGYQFAVLTGDVQAQAGWSSATYAADEIDDEGYIDGISVVNGGAGYTGEAVSYSQQMLATEYENPLANFDAGVWTWIPFRVRCGAGEIESEFGSSGNANTGDIEFDTNTLFASGDDGATGFLNLQNGDGEVVIGSNNNSPFKVSVNEDNGSKEWLFDTSGNLTLPPGGDIKDSNGTSVLGGGGNGSTGNITFNDTTISSTAGYPTLVNAAGASASAGGVEIDFDSDTVSHAMWLNGEDGLSIQINRHLNDGKSQWYFGPDGMLTFPDGTKQTTAYTGQTSGGELYIMANIDGNIVTSTDGITWSDPVASGMTGINRVEAHNGVIVYIMASEGPPGANGTEGLYYSTTIGSVTLCAGTDTIESSPIFWNNVHYFTSTNKWVAVGWIAGGTNNFPILAHSDNGISWTLVPMDGGFHGSFNPDNRDWQLTDIAYITETSSYVITSFINYNETYGGIFITQDITVPLDGNVHVAVGQNFWQVAPWSVTNLGGPPGYMILTPFSNGPVSSTPWFGYGTSTQNYSMDTNWWTPAVINQLGYLPYITEVAYDNNDFIAVTEDGQVITPSFNMGPSFAVSVPLPYTTTDFSITNTNPAVLSYNGPDQLIDNEKVIVTDSGEYNGTYYWKATDNTLYLDQQLTNALDASGFASFTSGGTITLSHGQYFDAAGTSSIYYYIGNDDEQVFRSSNGINWTLQADVDGVYFNDFAYSSSGSVTVINTGDITFDGTDIQGDGTYNNLGTINLVPNPTLRGSGQFVSIYPTNAFDYPHVHMTAGEGGELYLGDDYQYIKTVNDGSMKIGANNNSVTKEWTFGTDGNLTLPEGGDIKDSTGTSVLGGTSLAPELTKSGGNLVSTTTLEFQGNIYGAIFDVDSGGNFDVWFQTVTGDDSGKSYAIGSNDDGYNFVYAFNASGTISWKIGLDDILSYDNTAYGIKYSNGYLYLSCQYYNNDVGENQLSVLKLDADDGTVSTSWILTNSGNVSYSPADIAVNSSGDPIVVGQSYGEKQTFSGLTPQSGSGPQMLVVNASDLNNVAQSNPWGSYYIHTDPNDPSAWYSISSINHFVNVPTVVLTGNGDGNLTVDIRYMYDAGSGTWHFDWVTITNGGSGYNDPDQVKVLGSSIGGTDGVDDIIMSRNSWYMNVISVGGVSGNTCPSFVSDKIRLGTSQNVDYSTGTWDVRVGLNSQAFIWTPNWQHTYGDAESQDFISVSVDSSDNIYLLGEFDYYDGSSSHNVLAMKLNSSGSQQWTKYIEDNTGSQDPGSIFVDGSGNCFVINQNNNGYTLVTKLDSSGNVVWQVKQADSNNWNNHCVGGIDSNGDIIVMGSWYVGGNYITNIHKLSNSDGSLVWSRNFGNQQSYDMYEYYDENGQAGHVVGNSFYYGGYCYDANDDQYVGFGFRLPTDGTGTGTYGRYNYSINYDTAYEDNTNNAALLDYTYNPIDGMSMTSVEASASTTVDNVGTTTSNHWYIGTGGGLTGVDSITFSDGTILTTAEAGGGWTPGNNIVQTVDTELRIVVKDPNEDSYRLDLAVEDDNSTVKTRVDLDYDRVHIETNNGQYQWRFESSGELRIPGTVSTFDNDINIVAMNAGYAGNITIKTVANYNNVHFSSLDLNQNGINITVDMDNTPGGKTFEFRDSGVLVLPAGADIQDASGVSVIGKEPKFTLQYQNFNAVSGTRYCIDAVGQAVTATLPASPAIGDAIYFVDAYGAFSTNNFTIDGNGKNIMGSTTQVISTANESIGVFYNGAEWRTY